MLHNVAGVQNVVVDGSAVPVTVTGTTSEVEVGRILLPPYALGTAGILRLMASGSFTNNANVKNFRVRLGSLAGTQVGSGSFASVSTQLHGWQGFVRPDSIVYSTTVSSWAFGSALAMVVTPVDWSQEQTLILSMQLAVGTDTYTLQGWCLEGIRF